MSPARRKESKQHEVGSATHARRVIVAADGRGWYVRFEGNRQLGRYSNVTQAIHGGRRLARQHKPAGLVVRYLDGEEEESWYGDREAP
ncbi:DUF2188 domain-containing protein [Cystobacter ferrugineus]|uniref:DUF2188 domain-containing protein n=1 Tax=Cystobacter ferrugineus TaxID=83449 RepID=UPI000A62C778|nr:DUF2188 domain-containing protein [Cystobacter ferrugineus]